MEKRVIEAMMCYEWESKGLQAKMEKAIVDAVVLGEGKIPLDWTKDK